MTHTQIALSIWGVLIIGGGLTFVLAIGTLFGMKTGEILAGLALLILVRIGPVALILYTLWAIFGGH